MWEGNYLLGLYIHWTFSLDAWGSGIKLRTELQVHHPAPLLTACQNLWGRTVHLAVWRFRAVWAQGQMECKRSALQAFIPGCLLPWMPKPHPCPGAKNTVCMGPKCYWAAAEKRSISCQTGLCSLTMLCKSQYWMDKNVYILSVYLPGVKLQLDQLSSLNKVHLTTENS